MELNEKQIQIIKTAEKLFAENGYDGTSVRQIAKAANINVAMISYYFGSKEKMLGALLFYRTSDFKIQLESTISEEMSYLERVDALVALTIKRVHTNRRMYKIVHFEYSNLCRKLDFENYIIQKKENFNIVENFIQEGQEAGQFSKDVDIPLVFTTILGTYFNLYYNKQFYLSTHFKENISFDDYVKTSLTQHIQRTIKALLTYEL